MPGADDAIIEPEEKVNFNWARTLSTHHAATHTKYALALVAVVRTIYAEADGVALPEPDPANKQHNTYAWMTVHKFTPDRPVTYPFKDIKTLQ